MQKFQNGDKYAFEIIYERYADLLVNFLFKKLWQNRTLAEDKAQDIFTKIINKPELFDVTKNFRSWFFTIAYNLCKNEYKKHEVRRNTKYEIKEDTIIKDTLLKGDDLVDQNSFSEHLRKELDNLKEIHREVFEMRHDQGLSMKEIAEVMNVSEGTVKSRLHYTTKFLASKLEVFKTILID